jgi:hypothetical protein
VQITLRFSYKSSHYKPCRHCCKAALHFEYQQALKRLFIKLCGVFASSILHSNTIYRETPHKAAAAGFSSWAA